VRGTNNVGVALESGRGKREVERAREEEKRESERARAPEGQGARDQKGERTRETAR